MALNGDLDAFNQLILKHQDMAYCYAYSLLGDPVLAEDAVQESFIRGFQKLAGFRGCSFRAWILKIVTNSAYDMLRRSKRHPTSPLFPNNENSDEYESPFWLADPAVSVEKSVEQTEFSIALYRLLNELPEVFRSVITLIDLYELEYAEAAQALNVPIGTIKSRLARARLQMKQKLNGDNFGSNLTSASAPDRVHLKQDI
jgi:RNA polymerase sigma-70 factor (ECF subfamily)